MYPNKADESGVSKHGERGGQSITGLQREMACDRANTGGSTLG